MSRARATTETEVGQEMHDWVRDLLPLPRSLTGDGVRATLAYLGKLLPDLQIHEVPSGTRVLDWQVPDEWTFRAAWIETLDGRRVVDAADNILHVVGYSVPVDRVLSRDELENHLHLHPTLPDAIPYVTSYYVRRWGFCLTRAQYQSLGPGPFWVHIDAGLAPGNMTFADLLLPGRSRHEVLLTTYVCHPGMANNELSGPAVAVALARWLGSRERRYTYRFVFAPETLGAAVYLSRHSDHLKRHVVAGYVLTCLGDERAYSLVPSRLGDTLADRVAHRVLARRAPDHRRYSFLDRGSDERMYCSPLVDLPMAVVSRSLYRTYPEYHSSLDDLSVVTPKGLAGGFAVLRDCLMAIESNETFRAMVPGEPMLGPRGVKPTLSATKGRNQSHDLMDVYFYCDGRHDIPAVAERLGKDEDHVRQMIAILRDHGLVEAVDGPGTEGGE